MITLNLFYFFFNIWILNRFLFLVRVNLRSNHFNLVLNIVDCLFNFLFLSRISNQFCWLSLLIKIWFNALDLPVFDFQIRFLISRIYARRFWEYIVTCLKEDIVVNQIFGLCIWFIRCSYSWIRNHFELLPLDSHYNLFKFQIIKI